jgi:hypothetical protein
MTRLRFAPAALALALALPMSAPATAQTAAPPAAAVESFADIADLTLAAPVVLRATILKAEKLNRKEAPDVAAGRVRMLIDAQVQGVLTARESVPARISYLWEGPLDARGKAPRLKKADVLLFLRRVPGREGQYQLTSPHGQIAWTPRAEAGIRRVLTDVRSPELRDLRITGIGNAFHVRGSIPGEAESQIFLTTATGRPVSLVVLSRPGQAKSFSVALSDVIDDAAASVPRDTLMWYRLACALPAAIPPSAVDELTEEDRRAVAADYRFVRDSLGACARTLR